MLPMLVLALIPSTASANAGTPLMWAAMFHLVLGNAMIGLIEGLLLAWLFKCPKRKAIPILIAANYLSAWAGGLFVAGYLPSLVDVTIQNIRYWFLAFSCAAFVVTVLIEFPFFRFALGRGENRSRRTLKAALAVNGITCLLLFAWYWMASGTSMMSNLEVTSADEMDVPAPYVLYFISREGDQILRMDLNNPGSSRPISEVAAQHRNDRLFVRPRNGQGFDLLVFLDSDTREARTEARVLDDFSEQAPLEWRISRDHSEKAEGSWFNFGPVPTIAAESDWAFHTGFWPVEGIGGHNRKTGKRVHFSLELPFAAWNVRNATQIDEDLVVAQLGNDQICMIDPVSKRIALIARGKGPIVARPEPPNRDEP